MKLVDFCLLKKGQQLNKEELNENGKYYYINGGIVASGKYDKYNYDENNITISQGGASAGFVNWMTEKFYAGAHCYVVKTKDENILNNKYLYYCLKNSQEKLTQSQHGAGIPALDSKIILNLQIPLPPLNTQLKIVEVLDKFTELQKELQTELKLRKKQYEYYRDKLLTFSEEEREKWQVREVKIGECCEVLTGGEVPDDCMKGQKEPNEIYKYPVYTNGVEVYGYSSKYRVDKEAVTISSIGNVGYVAYRDEKFFPAIRLKVIIPKDKDIDTRYLYYIVKCIKFKGTNSSLSSMNSNDVKKYIISIPTLSRQKEIVEVLDKFDTLVNDISKGLPREIELRRRQYEYYRDRLLRF